MQFRSMYPSTTCPIYTALGPKSYSFLALALREALSESQFASVTCIFLAEADDWCASHANGKTSLLIFNNDTDLLLYAHAQEVKV